MLTRFHRHIGGTLLLASIGVLLAMLALMALFALMDELRDASEGYSFTDALVYVALSLPRRALEVLPYAVFLGSLVGLGSLAEHSELTVARAAEMSPSQMYLGVAAPALLLMALGFALGGLRPQARSGRSCSKSSSSKAAIPLPCPAAIGTGRATSS